MTPRDGVQCIPLMPLPALVVLGERNVVANGRGAGADDGAQPIEPEGEATMRGGTVLERTLRA